MKGKHEIVVKDAHLQYKFTITRNITILRGDSATGKTTLIDMILAYQTGGISSGVTVISDVKCVVLTSVNWKTNLSNTNNSIVFIDEGDSFVRTKEFAEAIQDSTNYFVIATRSSLFNLPYSVNEVYGIKNKSGNRYQGTKRLYSGFYQIYESDVNRIPKPDLMVVEDTNAGYEFFNYICESEGIKCISAGGKSGIYHTVLDSDAHTIVIVADGAAFGPEMERILSLKHIKNIVLYLPESFEWIVLKSGLIDGVSKELEQPEEYIESSKYFSWERFFNSLLVEKTKDTYLAYNKKRLNPTFLQQKETEKISAVIPFEK